MPKSAHVSGSLIAAISDSIMAVLPSSWLVAEGGIVHNRFFARTHYTVWSMDAYVKYPLGNLCKCVSWVCPRVWQSFRVNVIVVVALVDP